MERASVGSNGSSLPSWLPVPWHAAASGGSFVVAPLCWPLMLAARTPALPQAKTTKKIVLRLACTVCKAQHMHAIKVRGGAAEWG